MNRCPHCLRTFRAFHTGVKRGNKFKSQEKSLSRQAFTEAPQPTDNVDYVSSPNPESNIRTIVYSKATTDMEEYLNSKCSQTNRWNDEFWKQHNQRFQKEKTEFISRTVQSGNGQEMADKLSTFYKEFLEKNHETYANYNREWYRRNFTLLWMSFQTSISKLFSKRKYRLESAKPTPVQVKET